MTLADDALLQAKGRLSSSQAKEGIGDSMCRSMSTLAGLVVG